MLECHNLLSTDNLQKLELRLYNGDQVLESFFITINFHAANIDELESGFMQSIHNLETRCKSFQKLSTACRFKIFLCVKTYNFNDDQRCQDFLWIQDETYDKKLRSNASSEILPIVMNSPENVIQFYIEKFKPTKLNKS